jgi:hypothetical protein
MARRRGESHFGLERERRQGSAGGRGALLELADLSNRAGRRGDQVGAGEAIAKCLGGDAERTQGLRRDHELSGSGAQQALDTVAALAVADRLQQTDILERAHVVADALAREREGAGDTGRRFRLAHVLEDPEAHGVE